MRVLIAGCGFVGTELGIRLAAAGHEVWGLRRTIENLPSEIRGLRADLRDPSSLVALPVGIEALVFAAAGDASDDASYRATYVDGLRHILDALVTGRHPLRTLLFTSSTGVYDQTDGSWVDEESPTRPSHFSGIRMLEAERIALAAPCTASVLRLGGLYGPRRNRLIERVRAGTATFTEPALFTNRIHRDDAAGALAHLFELAQPQPIYLGVDHDPCTEETILRWLAQQLNVAPPRLSDSPTVARRSNKRCRNDRLVQSGYRFTYPTFREGYLQQC